MSEVPVNCIAFDQLGTRLFAGDAAGSLTEVSLDLTPLSAAAVSWSQSGWGAAAAGTGSSHSSCSGQQAGASCGTHSSSCGDAAVTSSSGSACSSGSGLLASGGEALVASVLRHGSSAAQQLAGTQKPNGTMSYSVFLETWPANKFDAASCAPVCCCPWAAGSPLSVTSSPPVHIVVFVFAGAQLMRKLRVSQELGGCPIMSLMCHPGGHHLIALAR